MYQFQIYPSGDVSNYRTRVNSVSGVTAIIDRQMGIIEHSLSGVALYIKAVNDYVNQHNVGTLAHPIVSGFFTHLGYTFYGVDSQDLSYPYKVSLDGIISGVNTIYSSGLSVYVENPFVQKLITNSGICYNSIINNGFDGLNTAKRFLFDGVQQNIYSGLIPEIESQRLYDTQPLVTTETTYPFRYSSNAIMNGILFRYRLDISNDEQGISKDLLLINNLYVNTDINVSGNISIYGVYKPDFSIIDSGDVSESLLNLRSHNHDGVNSAQLDFSKFNSAQLVTDHFSIAQTSGNINVGRAFIGNSIGLCSDWEVVDVSDVDNVQKLLTCKNKLYVLDNTKLIEVHTGEYIEVQKTQFPNALAIATKSGDTPAIIGLVIGPNQELDGASNVNGVCITAFNTKESKTINFGYRGLSNYFNEVVTRTEIPICNGIRIGSNIYYLFLEEIRTSSNDIITVFSLYEINTINVSSRVVAHYETPGTDWKFLKPCVLKNCLYFFYTTTDDDYITLVYNVIYRPSSLSKIQDTNTSITYYNKHEAAIGERIGFNVFIYDETPAIIESTGLERLAGNLSPIKKDFSTTSYFDGKLYISAPYNEFTAYITQQDRNRFSVWQGEGKGASIISYAGKLWFGNGLEYSRDFFRTTQKYSYLLNTINTIAGSTNAQIYYPIVFNGWLYGIVPQGDKDVLAASDNFTTNISVRDRLPAGCLIVRRRAAETDLVDMMAYSR